MIKGFYIKTFILISVILLLAGLFITVDKVLKIKKSLGIKNDKDLFTLKIINKHIVVITIHCIYTVLLMIFMLSFN